MLFFRFFPLLFSLCVVMVFHSCTTVLPVVNISANSNVLHDRLGVLINREIIELSCNCQDSAVNITITSSKAEIENASIDVGYNRQIVTLKLESNYEVALKNEHQEAITKNGFMTSTLNYSVSDLNPLNDHALDQWQLGNLIQIHLNRIVVYELQQQLITAQ